MSTEGFVGDTDRQLNNYVGRFKPSTYAFKDGDPCYLIAIPFDPSAFASEATALNQHQSLRTLPRRRADPAAGPWPG